MPCHGLHRRGFAGTARVFRARHVPCSPRDQAAEPRRLGPLGSGHRVAGRPPCQPGSPRHADRSHAVPGIRRVPEAGPEVRGARAARRRDRARLQQPDHDDVRKLRSVASQIVRSRPRGPRLRRGPPPVGGARGAALAPAPRVQPSAAPRAEAGLPGCDRTRYRAHAHPDYRGRRSTARPGVCGGRSRARRSRTDQPGAAQPCRQRARRDAARRHAHD